MVSNTQSELMRNQLCCTLFKSSKMQLCIATVGKTNLIIVLYYLNYTIGTVYKALCKFGLFLKLKRAGGRKRISPALNTCNVSARRSDSSHIYEAMFLPLTTNNFVWQFHCTPSQTQLHFGTDSTLMIMSVPTV